jgi:hypothetical protein
MKSENVSPRSFPLSVRETLYDGRLRRCALLTSRPALRLYSLAVAPWTGPGLTLEPSGSWRAHRLGLHPLTRRGYRVIPTMARPALR